MNGDDIININTTPQFEKQKESSAEAGQKTYSFEYFLNSLSVAVNLGSERQFGIFIDIM
jgi:hypothetical protein